MSVDPCACVPACLSFFSSHTVWNLVCQVSPLNYLCFQYCSFSSLSYSTCSTFLDIWWFSNDVKNPSSFMFLQIRWHLNELPAPWLLINMGTEKGPVWDARSTLVSIILGYSYDRTIILGSFCHPRTIVRPFHSCTWSINPRILSYSSIQAVYFIIETSYFII